MKLILVATDLSDRSENAVRRANLLARTLPAQLVVMHVVDEDLPEKMIAAGAQAARESMEAAQHAIPVVERAAAELVVQPGMDWRTIVNETDLRNCDLIVLGIHRMSVSGYMHGSTMERVIRATHRPVLVVRDPVRGSYSNVMAAVDFSVAARHAVLAAMHIAPDAEFNLVHAYHVPFGAFLGQNKREELLSEEGAKFDHMVEDEMASFIAALDGSSKRVRSITREGRAMDVIEAEVRALKPELLVLGTRGRTGAAITLLGSVALALLECPPCDVLLGQAW